MKMLLYHIILFFCCPLLLHSQIGDRTQTRFVAGIAVPELVHLGANIDLGNYNQIGASAGILLFYGYHPTFNIENRFYLTSLNDNSKRTKWFIRQAGSYFFIIDEDIGGDYQYSLLASVGTDLLSKSGKNGWTIDLGCFIAFPKKGSLPPNENHRIGPSIRIQYFSYFKKRKFG